MIHYALPTDFEGWLEAQLKKINYSLADHQRIAAAIQETSDYFIATTQQPTPWESRTTLAAYLAYYLPLNYIRTCKVLAEGQRVDFFANTTTVIDFGCGPGTGSKALFDHLPSLKKFFGMDIHQALAPLYQSWNPQAFKFLRRYDQPPEPFLLILNYVFNELPATPPWFLNAEKIMIVEPATYHDSQRLHQVRAQFLAQGYFVWAPCLHQETCPVLGHKKDWCHDSVQWSMPPWLSNIEQHLPMKNEHLTFSYLLLAKTPPPQPEGLRIIGDARPEKGKTKWLFCQPRERQFLSCLARDGDIPEIHRGDIVAVSQWEVKPVEWRFKPEDFTKIVSFAKSPTFPKPR